MRQCHTYPDTIDKEANIRDLLQGWDRVAFGVACRQMEVLILRGQHDAALRVLRQQFRQKSPQRPTLQSPLVDVLPYRLADELESHGFTTLASVHGTTDEDLLAIANVGPSSIDLIRQTVRCVIARQPLPYQEDLSDLEPEWELPVVSFQTEGERIVSRVEEALAVLLESGDAALAEIDAKIGKLNIEIDNLKRMRKLLAPAAPEGRKARGPYKSADFGDLAQQIAKVIKSKGPMKPSAVAEQLGLSNYTHIGRCVAATPELLAKNATGEITLADAA